MQQRNAPKLVCAVFLTLMGAGCSKAPPPPAELPPTTLPAPATETSSDLPSEPTESGLAIKRGIVTLEADHSTFRPCGEQTDLFLVDQGENVLAKTFAGEKDANGVVQPLKLYLEAYGERSNDVPEAAKGFAGVFVLEEALYAAPEEQAHGCDTPPRDYIVAARGSEPDWSAEVTEAALNWRQPEDPKELSVAAPQTQDSEGAVSYIAASNDHKVELLIEAQACRDATSGEYFAYAARAKLDGKEFAGCARVGR